MTDRRKNSDTAMSVVTRRACANTVGLSVYKTSETKPPALPNSRLDHQNTTPPSATLSRTTMIRDCISIASGSFPIR